MDQATYDKGRQIRAAVLGEEYVANAERQADDFSKPLQDLLTEYCWGCGVGAARSCRSRPAACSIWR